MEDQLNDLTARLFKARNAAPSFGRGGGESSLVVVHGQYAAELLEQVEERWKQLKAAVEATEEAAEAEDPDFEPWKPPVEHRFARNVKSRHARLDKLFVELATEADVTPEEVAEAFDDTNSNVVLAFTR